VGGIGDRAHPAGTAHHRGQAHARRSALKADIEQRTDTIALSAYEVLDDTEIERLVAALTPLARAVIDSGDVPGLTPIGVTLDR
jgi:Helix-turn-helix family